MRVLNCPNCGSDLESRFAAVKMTTCASCETTLYLESDHFRDAGSSGEMHDVPLLFQVGKTVRTGADTHTIIGHARFSYGTGWWDEFFATTEKGEEVWLSVDEGDVVVQRALSPGAAPDIWEPPELGAFLSIHGAKYRVTERETAICIALRGEFPEVLEIGATYEFVNCQGEDGTLLSGEFSTGAPDWYSGAWLDQYTIEIETVS